MTTQIQEITNSFEDEVVSPEMIETAVNNCFVSVNDETHRALELDTFDDKASIEEDDEGDLETQEIETEEEVSLKNGVYHEIKRKLQDRFGIPADEIAFIHDADTPAKKAELFKAVNSGRVRVLIGSTSKLGTGVNVQKRLIALHHLDEPWKPAELEQREGRILRQGNIYPEVFIFHYVTERSFDGYMLQTLESKARFISQIMAGEVTARTAEDVGDMVLTVAQVKAIASGNPAVQRRIELEVKLVKLDRLRAAFYNNRLQMRADLEELPQTIASKELEITGHEKAITSRLPLVEDGFNMTLKKKLGESEVVTFDKRERAGAHLRYLADLLTDTLRRGAGGSLTEEVGTYRGFEIYVHTSGNVRFEKVSSLFNFQSEIHLRAEDGTTCYIAQISDSNTGITQSIDYASRHIEDRLEQARSQLEMLKTKLERVKAEVDKPWFHVAEYARIRREYETLGKSLQAEGIEIESNTTFTTEEVDQDELETAANTENATNTVQTQDELEDFGTRAGNPFTGLEDWAITVDEPLDSESGCDFTDKESDCFGSLNFNLFSVVENGSVDAQGEEPDIFLDSSLGDESAFPFEAVINSDFSQPLPSLENCNASESYCVKPVPKKKRPNTKKKATRQKSSSGEQAGFFWS